MVRFYDPKDAGDLARVEHLLAAAGIEYFLQREPSEGIGPFQILVAEEDLARAEALMRRQTMH